MLTISEIYPSLQGEGRLTGTPSVLIRTSGCNLRCTFCDTPFTSWEPEGRAWPIDEIVAETLRHELAHVVITGGEPMIAAGLGRLCEQLSAAGLHITIETAGTRFRDVPCDLMSISPKLANSDPPAARSARWSRLHAQRRHRPDVVARLLDRYDGQLKYVVDGPQDVAEVEMSLAAIAACRSSAPVGASVAEFEDAARPASAHLGSDDAASTSDLDRYVWLMPQGVDPVELKARQSWLEPLCRERGWSYCHRKHIEWFGHTRRT